MYKKPNTSQPLSSEEKKSFGSFVRKGKGTINSKNKVYYWNDICWDINFRYKISISALNPKKVNEDAITHINIDEHAQSSSFLPSIM